MKQPEDGWNETIISDDRNLFSIELLLHSDGAFDVKGN